ncbi:MAG: hypothetical protein Q9217_003395 [Psora testacea]
MFRQPYFPRARDSNRLRPTSRALGLRERHQILKREVFTPWLVQRLELLAKASSDIGYTTFLKNFKTAIQTNGVWRHPKTDDDPRSPTGVWRPLELNQPRALLTALKEAFSAVGESAVDTQLLYSYNGLVANGRFRKVDVADQQQLSDLRYPVEWYPATRAIQRTIHLHVGPTNSGKTYHALKRLEEAKSGVYAGPLRLLAHEIYSRLNAKGKICDLVTGDERIINLEAIPSATMKSCTVEMVPLNEDFDVAVIDEIQMIAHQQRGWAWTQALLGLKAREVHLCGEERTVPLIRELVASMGDKLEIHTYKRLSPLKTMSTSLRGSLSELRKGDCVVVFSRVGIHAMKRDIERATQKRVAVVYGSLPPEIRAQQARLFNDPDNDYDVLVASDAIGMGLNLAIKRIIFESLQKYNGSFHEIIAFNEIKQIAGRAGRFRTAAQAEREGESQSNESSPTIPSPNLGLVTTLEECDLPIVRKAMENEAAPIMSAGIFPPTSVLIKFAAYFPPSTSFSYILLRLHEISLMHPRFTLCQLKDQIPIADVIQPVKNLTTQDRIIFCAAPANTRQKGMDVILAAFARCVGENSSGALLDIPELPLDILDEEITLDRNYLERLEKLHKALILYLWLSYRFAGVFINQAMAFYVKGLVEERIDKMLAEFSASPQIRERIRKMREKALERIHEMAESPSDNNENEFTAETEMPDKSYIHDLSDEPELADQPLRQDIADRLYVSPGQTAKHTRSTYVRAERTENPIQA